MAKTSTYWFPAKRYGWGWAVLVVWFIALVIAAFVFSPRRPVFFQLVVVGLVLALIVVCYTKGEPPSWRWGDRK
jgi:hypothetical protein